MDVAYRAGALARHALLLLALVAYGPAAAVPACPPLDVNRATAAELAECLPGIGSAKGAAIVEWRTANGPFETVDALIEVPGIGPRTLERLRQLVTVSGPLAEAAAARERRAVLAVRRAVERARAGVP